MKPPALVPVLVLVVVLLPPAALGAWPMLGGDPAHSGARGVVDGGTGAVLWSLDLGEPAAEWFQRPVPGEELVFLVGDLRESQDAHGVIVAVDPDAREVIWRHRTYWAPAAPAVLDGRVFVSASYDDVGGSLEDEDGNLSQVVVLDEDTGQVAWERRFEHSGAGTPAVDEDTVYLATGTRLLAVDRATHETRWQDWRSGTVGAPVLADDSVFLPIKGDGLVALDPADGEPIWETELTGLPVGTPAFEHGRVFTSTFVSGGRPSGILYALDAATGRELFSLEHDRFGASTVSLVQPSLAACPDEGSCWSSIALTTQDGVALVDDDREVLWHTHVSDIMEDELAIGEEAVHAAGHTFVNEYDDRLNGHRPPGITPYTDPNETSETEGQIIAIDEITGEVTWRVFARGQTSPPLILGGVAYSVSQHGILYALDAGQGAPRDGPARIAAVDLAVRTQDPDPGTSVRIEVLAKNLGSTRGTGEIELVSGNQTVGSSEVTLWPGQTERLEFWTVDVPAEGWTGIRAVPFDGGEPSHRVQARAAGAPGPGALAALAVLACLAFLRPRRT